ncbi:hypothetical protein BC828DRAFT_403450 [Blastocladiella britannica]|nr:hypothetical protein BC828DRAFT_403450 [Blastocladiella britannica]
MSAEQPWLADDFDPSRATKWDLRRYIAMYGPDPPEDAKKSDLERIFRSQVYNQRHRLRSSNGGRSSVTAIPMPLDLPSADFSSIRFNRRTQAAVAAAPAVPVPTKTPAPTAAPVRPRLPEEAIEAARVPWSPNHAAAHSMSSPGITRRKLPIVVDPPPAVVPASRSRTNMDPPKQKQPPRLPKGALSSRPPRRDRVDALVTLLRLAATFAIVVPGALYVLAWSTSGYCSSSAAHPPGLTTSTELALPPWLAAAHAIPGLASVLPAAGCLPCPTGADCKNGRAVRCRDPHALLVRTGWVFGSCGCVPDEKLRSNVDKLMGQVVNIAQRRVGQALCAAGSPVDIAAMIADGNDRVDWPGVPADAWLPREHVRDAILPAAAAQYKWPAEQARGYKVEAERQIFDDPSDPMPTLLVRAVAPDQVLAISPVFPWGCEMRWAVQRLAARYWPHFSAALVAMLAVAALHRRYKRRAARRAMAARLTGRILDLLEAASTHADDDSANLPAYLGIAALQQKFRREMVDGVSGGHSIAAGEWAAVWDQVEVELEQDPDVRRIVAKYRGEVIEGWEWIGFGALGGRGSSSL